MAGSAGPAIGDFLAREVFKFTHGCIALNVPKSVHAGDLCGGNFDRRLFDEGADDRQRPGAQTDLGVAGNYRLHVLAAAAGEHGIDVYVVLTVKTLLMGDIDRQGDSEEYAVRNDDDNFVTGRGGPSQRS